jgi:glycosyltransferase involved in cell wall biosynthesis
VLSFSQWFADWLVEHDGVPRERVHVVGGGVDELPAKRDLRVRGPGGTKVLFIGREFFRKGGELVVAAIEQLRASGSGDFTVTIVGPSTWPWSTPAPDWVDFRGELPASEARQLWADHDIFALPTWYEPYGKVFLEARAAGVPALGRAAYCMPELVPASAGRLIPRGGGVEAVAEELLAISKNHDLFASADADSDGVRTGGSWANVADRAVSSMRNAITS